MSLTAKTAQQIKERILKISNDENYPLPDNVANVHKGATIGWLNKYLGGDENRRLVLAWLFGKTVPVSSKDLTDRQLIAIADWLGLHKDDVIWETQPCFAAESSLVLSEAMRWYKTLPPGNAAMFEGSKPPSMIYDVVAFCNGTITAMTDEHGVPLFNEDVSFQPDSFPKNEKELKHNPVIENSRKEIKFKSMF